MANDKFYGYSPSPKKGSIGVHYGNDNRLDRVNPYEFKKGMDYELATMGISRLNESDPLQRQTSTDKVLKNLATFPAYYSCKIQYETEYRNTQGKKPSFNKYMKEKYESKMKPVDQTYKNDKMVALKEAIKNEIRSILSEKKRPDYPDVDKDGDREESMEKALKDKEAKAKDKGKNEAYGDEKVDNDGFPAGVSDKDKEKIKGLKKSSKKEGSGDKEVEDFEKATPGDPNYDSEKLAIKQFGIGEGDDDGDDDDVIAKKAAKKAKQKSKDKKAAKKRDSVVIQSDIKKAGKQLEKIKAEIKEFARKFNSGKIDKETYFAKVGDKPKQKTELDNLIDKLKKEFVEAEENEAKQRQEVAATAMDRDVNRKLLEIIKEAGAPLHEGAAGVKMHYDIARKAYMEGLINGLNES